MHVHSQLKYILGVSRPVLPDMLPDMLQSREQREADTQVIGHRTARRACTFTSVTASQGGLNIT